VDPGSIYAVLAIGLIAVVGFGWYFSPSNKLKRELRAARRYPLGELPEETRGRVVGAAHTLEQTLDAPLTGCACL
jgi:hypothetical protein